MSDELTAEAPKETNGTTRGRPRGSTNKPKAEAKRRYAAELAELQARVDAALKLLERPVAGEAKEALVAIAVETLKGE